METTINVHTEILEKIKETAVSKGISCSRMIRILMQKVMAEDMQYVRMGRLVKYQKRCRKEDWRKFHVKLRGDEYEYFHDLKKILKMSVSLILADDIVDNFPYNHIISEKVPIVIGTFIIYYIQQVSSHRICKY